MRSVSRQVMLHLSLGHIIDYARSKESCLWDESKLANGSVARHFVTFDHHELSGSDIIFLSA